MHKFIFSFLVCVGICGIADAREITCVDEEYWEDVVPGKVIVGYDKSIDVHNASLVELGISDKGVFKIVKQKVTSLNCVLVQVPENIEEMKKFIKLMEKHPKVKYAEPDRWIKLSSISNDEPYYDDSLWVQWDKTQMGCECAWEHTCGDMSISIAIVDQGIQYTHPDLEARYGSYKGYDFYGNDADPMIDSSSEIHGTICAGVAAATINNAIGVTGVAEITLLSYRCGVLCINNYASVSAIVEAADHGVNVISMSWGSSTPSTALHDAIIYAWDKGCLFCGAVGGCGLCPIPYPAAYDEVIAVGVIDSDDTRWCGCNYGPKLELVAGGMDITSTVPFDMYNAFSGTFIACANVAGAAALVWSADTSLTNKEVRAILDSTARDLGEPGWDEYYGYGVPDLCAAITGVEEIAKKKRFTELECYPNPMRKLTSISYYLPDRDKVSLKIYDVTGRIVKTLVDEEKEAGSYDINWDSRGLTTGIYFAKFVVSDYNETKKLILVK